MRWEKPCSSSSRNACTGAEPCGTCHALTQLVEDEDDEKDPHRKLTDLWRTQNVAIPLSYFVVGFALTFISTPITYYAVDTLDADSALVNTLSCVQVSDYTPMMFMLMCCRVTDDHAYASVCVVCGHDSKSRGASSWCTASCPTASPSCGSGASPTS